MEGLDWSAPELLDALQAEYWNGFGFQCDAKQSCVPTRIYIAKPFNTRCNPVLMPRDAGYVPQWSDDVDLAVVRNALPPDIPHEDLWITDFIGHDFVTVHTRQYLNIPRIFDAFLSCGYGFVTHTAVKVRYLPGEHFTRLSFERKIIEQLRVEYRQWSDLRPRERNIWRVVVDFTRPFPLVQHWNWGTPEGRALCSEIRSALGKKRDRCKHDARMLWPKYAEVAQRYQILHVGGWSAYDTGLGVVVGLPAVGVVVGLPAAPPPAAEGLAVEGLAIEEPVPEKMDDNDDEEILCMVCLSEPPDTIAMPCGHIVVCHTCSDQLAVTNTVNKTRCVQCQRPITHVEK